MPTAPTPFPALPRQARAFILTIVALALGCLIATQATTDASFDPVRFSVCLTVCAAGSFFEVQAPGGYWLQPHLPVFVFAALLAPPIGVAVLAVAVFLPGGVKRREDPYRIAFNAANLMLAGLAAETLAQTLPSGSGHSRAVAGLFAGSLALIAVNHGLLSAVTSLARGERLRRAVLRGLGLRETFGVSLALDLALVLTGASCAALWSAYPEALPLAAGPVALACAALWLPTFRHASRVDSKTGLFNYTHVRQLMGMAVADAQRRGHPTSVLMVDLDHLRAINNRHGHLVGDQLIATVARTILDCTDGRGSAGRFGGEEFCAVLPELDATEASGIAEEIRRRVAEQHLSGDGPPPTSVSVGVASFPAHGTDVESVLHAADMALYDAKLGGRNRVRIAAPQAAGLIPEPAPRPVAADPTPQPPAAPAPGARISWIPPLSVILISATVATALLADHAAIGAEPILFAGLLVSTLVLDAIRIEVFARLHTSPAALPVLALAALFGPLGPITAEALIVCARVLKRAPALQWSFDFGALSMAGLAAASTFTGLEHAGVDVIPAALASGIAYYAVNIPLVATVVWLARGTSPLANFREQLAWLLPHYATFGALAGLFVEVWHSSGYSVFALFGLPTALLWVGEQQYLERSRTGVEDLRRSHTELERANAELRRLLADNQALLHRLQSAYLSTITSLARTIEAKDPYTGGHTDRVSRLAGTLAAELGFTSEELQAVEVGAAIHDIGKIGVSDATLLKNGPLTPDERREIEQHPEISSYILAELDVPPIVKQMVRSHHERFDGTGYPDRIAGEEIPLSARILAVADALDAMTSDRPYRSAMSMVEALRAIDAGVGTQFCPEVVAALHKCLAEERPTPHLRPVAVA
jgi:diguanylate cyclase (GGDEF)-like protein/putative nucleotidyltransferase with HDIG domain